MDYQMVKGNLVPLGMGYVGQWKDGKKHGQGKETFPYEGRFYVGGYKEGKFTWSRSLYLGKWMKLKKENGRIINCGTEHILTNTEILNLIM